MGDTKFMQIAIDDAYKTKHHFGAMIVKNGKIISKMGKRPKGDPRYHAETQAIFNATKKLKTKDLKECTLYSTCEPCPMCFYMAWITGIKKIVYGASVKDAKKLNSPQINVTINYLNKRSGKKIELKPNVLRKQCIELLKQKY
jgi:guanine deaminase